MNEIEIIPEEIIPEGELVTEPRGPGGRPVHEPTDQTRKLVKGLAAFGIPQDDICKMIDVSDQTLRKYYRHELDTGLPEANAKMAQCLFNQGMGGNTAAMIFWMKARAGWRETQVNEHTGPGGTALVLPTVNINFITSVTKPDDIVQIIEHQPDAPAAD